MERKDRRLFILKPQDKILDCWCQVIHPLTFKTTGRAELLEDMDDTGGSFLKRGGGRHRRTAASAGPARTVWGKNEIKRWKKKKCRVIGFVRWVEWGGVTSGLVISEWVCKWDNYLWDDCGSLTRNIPLHCRRVIIVWWCEKNNIVTKKINVLPSQRHFSCKTCNSLKTCPSLVAMEIHIWFGSLPWKPMSIKWDFILQVDHVLNPKGVPIIYWDVLIIHRGATARNSKGGPQRDESRAVEVLHEGICLTQRGWMCLSALEQSLRFAFELKLALSLETGRKAKIWQ